MKRLIGILMGAAALLLSAQAIPAQDQLVPAGTLLQCTLDEPNFSSATAAIGDPVLCHLKTTQEFGRPMFPRGSMLGGHLEADKEPGHFVGKGYLKLTFDRVILPNGDLPLPAKVIQARGYKVDKQGAVDGKGHAERDVVEWMPPPLWPWKVLSLPARGPRPTLKGEEPLELRLMDDIVIPHVMAELPHLDRPPYARQSSYTTPSSSNAMQANPMQLAAASSPSTSNVTSAIPAVLDNARTTTQTQQPGAVQNSKNLTMLVLNTSQMIEVAKYYRDGDLMIITDTQGRSGSIEMSTVDWRKTYEMTGQLRSGDAPLLTRQLN
jgi:hypothetical protein